MFAGEKVGKLQHGKLALDKLAKKNGWQFGM